MPENQFKFLLALLNLLNLPGIRPKGISFLYDSFFTNVCFNWFLCYAVERTGDDDD